MSWFSQALGSAFGIGHDKPKNPATGARNIIGQIPGATQPYYDPYIQSGRKSLDTLQSEYGNLVNNPGGTYNHLGQDYKESPGYQFRLKQALSAGDNAYAAGGMAGSPAHQAGNMETAEGYANKDYEDYIKHVMDLYGYGLNGEKGLNEQGYNASNTQATNVGNALAQQGGYSFAGQNIQNQQRQQQLHNLISAITAAFGGGSSGSLDKLPNTIPSSGGMFF